MKLAYAGYFDLRHRSAAPLAHYHAAAGLARLGHEVTLLVPRPSDVPRSAVEAEFARALDDVGLARIFALRALPVWTVFGRGRISYGALVALWARRKRVDVLWSRYLPAADFAARIGVDAIAEHHMMLSARSEERCRRMLARPHLRAFVTISDVHRRLLMETYGYPAEKLVVGHSAVDLTAFDARPEAPPAALEPFVERPKVVLVGSLYGGRGIEDLVEVASELVEADFLIFGGPEDAARRWASEVRERGLANAFFLGPVRRREVPAILGWADVLFLPSTEKVEAIDGTPIGDFASPLKLFEFMASGTPIVTTALGPVTEVVDHEKEALLVPPRDRRAMATALRRILGDPALGESLGRAARRRVEQHTWEAKGRRILDGAVDGFYS